MLLRYIESFLTLYDELNFTKASQKLFISQQGLSKQIHSLENELGVSLFIRAKNGVIPTPLSRKLYPHFREMQNRHSHIKKLIQSNASEEDAPIIIAFASGISHGLNTDVIMNFQQANPKIRFEIKEWSQKVCEEKILNREADIALVVNPKEPDRFNTHYLTEGYMYVAIHKNHPLALSGDPIPFNKLDGENIITGSEENALRELFDDYCRMTGTQPNISFSSSYSLDIINSSGDKVAITTVTPIMARKITNPHVVIRRLLTPEPGCLYCCTNKSVTGSSSYKIVLDYIKDYFSRIPVISIEES